MARSSIQAGQCAARALADKRTAMHNCCVKGHTATGPHACASCSLTGSTSASVRLVRMRRTPPGSTTAGACAGTQSQVVTSSSQNHGASSGTHRHETRSSHGDAGACTCKARARAQGAQRRTIDVKAHATGGHDGLDGQRQGQSARGRHQQQQGGGGLLSSHERQRRTSLRRTDITSAQQHSTLKAHKAQGRRRNAQGRRACAMHAAASHLWVVHVKGCNVADGKPIAGVHIRQRDGALHWAVAVDVAWHVAQQVQVRNVKIGWRRPSPQACKSALRSTAARALHAAAAP